MLRVLVVSRRFYPPWCDGTVSYTKGLVEALLNLESLGEDVQVTVLGLTDNLWFGKGDRADLEEFKEISAHVVTLDGTRGKPENTVLSYLRTHDDPMSVVHVTYPGLDPISVRLALGSQAPNIRILKHFYMTPSNSIKSRFLSKLYQVLPTRKISKSTNVYSSDYLRTCYENLNSESTSIRSSEILPPAIDTKKFRKIQISNMDLVQAFFSNTHDKHQTLNFLDQSDFRIVYFGPLIHERCRYDRILQALDRVKKSGLPKASLIMFGRGFEDAGYLSQISDYASKIGVSNSIVLVAKPLSEADKLLVLNCADVVLQPYPPSPRLMSIVDPPITVLEAMATERKVIVPRLKRLEDFIEDGLNGFFIHDLEASSLEKAIIEASKTNSSVGINARRTVQDRFSLESVAEELQRIYGQLAIAPV